ncbi:hypothetical protein EW145_g5688 [Phellinidium pouzarii]|uniref:Uncharacterized protein n=1 Tax=Phellinidium pouzarii TaxID=167371 RepID=A0A4V3XC32_9AGAM|nr:hypothetical protein EW145_g5688 [Phellinidium pouzarii]
MSIAYASTSFGSTPTPSSSRTQPARSSRHQRLASQGSLSGATPYVIGTPSLQTPETTTGLVLPSSTHVAMRVQYDQIGSFFGAQREVRNSGQSRASSQQDHGRSSSEARTLPPYDSRSDIEALPTYSKTEEYDAMFFPLWIIGIIAPFVKPLHDPTRDNRTKEDQELDDANMRQIELRWAKRCAIALLTFVILVIVAVVVGVTVANQH